MYDSGYFLSTIRSTAIRSSAREKLKSNRMARSISTSRTIAVQGQGIELATCASGRFHPDAAHVWPQEKNSFIIMAPGRSAVEESRLNQRWRRRFGRRRLITTKTEWSARCTGP